MKNVLIKYPFIKESTIIFKYFLRSYGLNDETQGGLSSYSIFHLIYGFILCQLRKKNQEKNQEKIKLQLKYINLGTFIKKLLYFILYEFNFLECGLNNINQGEIFFKRDKGYDKDLVVILSPFNDKLNIAKSTNKYNEVLNGFYNLYCNLQNYERHFVTEYKLGNLNLSNGDNLIDLLNYFNGRHFGLEDLR